jgi:hypothetical protein
MTRLLRMFTVFTALSLGSCLADFDRTYWDFTEGPIDFHLDARQLELPESLLDDSSGTCEVARVDCADGACELADSACNLDNVCIPELSAVLSQPVDMHTAYTQGNSRLAAVSIEEISAELIASDLNTALSEVRVLWAPLEAPQSEARLLATIEAIEPSANPGDLEPLPVDEGVRSLESHLVTYGGFRLFLVFVAVAEPGASCPAGALDMELSMRLLLTGEPII